MSAHQPTCCAPICRQTDGPGVAPVRMPGAAFAGYPQGAHLPADGAVGRRT
jgi:hypothetical protein